MADGGQRDLAPTPDVAAKEPERALGESATRVSHALLGLQRSAGNRSTLAFAQAKLIVGPAADPAEREADDIADAVLRRLRDGAGEGDADGDGDGDIAGGPPAIRRSAGGGDDPLGGLEVDPATSGDIERARSGGRSLPPSARMRMETGFGQSFDGVRIHDGAEADRLNRSLQAQAFTTGRDIFFRSGSYRPGTSHGDELLAHELAHVVQQGGSVSRRRVHRKMWTKEQFAKATSEGALTAKSDAQKQIELMITEYITTFESHGVVLKEDLPRAVNLLLQLKQSVDWWIGDHTVDVDNNLGGVSTIEDPKRKKRMGGMKEFRLFLADEINTLQNQQRAIEKDDGSEGDITTEITEKSPGFLKLERKYAGDAKSFFTKIGTLIEKAVPQKGDLTELEVEVQFPIDPSGVGFIGARFKAEVERDKYVRIRAELAVTGGVNVGIAELKAEIGGYIEAQAPTGGEAMELISYDLYRRFRESHAIPNEAANFMWGGDTGKYGFGKAEEWSLAIERKLFDIPDVDPNDPKFAGITDPTAKAEAIEKAKEKVKDKREEIYVESGGLVGVGASLDFEVLNAEVSVAYTEGRRIDWKSLQNRKGGAGQKNLKSDSKIAKGARAISGGTRGAQKGLGRTVRTLAVAGEIEAELGLFKVGGGVEFSLGWESDGKRETLGTPPTISLEDVSLEFSLKGSCQLGELVGGGFAGIINTITNKAIVFIREKALPKAQEESGELKPGSKKGGGEVGKMAEGARLAYNALDALNSLAEDEGEEESGGMLEQLGAEAESETGVEFSLELDLMEGGGDFEIRKAGELSVEIPKALSVKLTKSNRILKVSYKEGVWKFS